MVLGIDTPPEVRVHPEEVQERLAQSRGEGGRAANRAAAQGGCDHRPGPLHERLQTTSMGWDCCTALQLDAGLADDARATSTFSPGLPGIARGVTGEQQTTPGSGRR